MSEDPERATEHTHLLPHAIHNGRLDVLRSNQDAESILSSHLSKEEQALGNTALGERLPYNSYTTIDWLHDLVRGINHYGNVNTDCELGERLISASSYSIKVGPAISPLVCVGIVPRMDRRRYNRYHHCGHCISCGHCRSNRQRLEGWIL